MLPRRCKSSLAVLVVAFILPLSTGCEESPVEALQAPLGEPIAVDRASQDEGGGGELPLSLCAPGDNDFTLNIDNEFFPLPVGRRWTLAGKEQGTSLRLRITVLGETEKVGNVRTRVVEEREWEDDEIIEISRNFYAQTSEGTVCYFGEEVDIYENGEIVSHAGAWRADEPGHAPGIFMPDEPEVGMTYQQEFAPGIAEDTAEVIAEDQTVKVPLGIFRETLRVRDFNPLDGDSGEKVYEENLGLIVDGPVKLVAFRP